MDRLACLYLTGRACALIEVFWMQVLSMMYTSRLQVVVTCKHFWLGRAPQQAPHFVWTIVSVLFVRVYVKSCVHFMWSLLIYGQSFTCLARTIMCTLCSTHHLWHTKSLFLLYSWAFVKACVQDYHCILVTLWLVPWTPRHARQKPNAHYTFLSYLCLWVPEWHFIKSHQFFLFGHTMKLYFYHFLHQLIPYTSHTQ